MNIFTPGQWVTGRTINNTPIHGVFHGVNKWGQGVIETTIRSWHQGELVGVDHTYHTFSFDNIFPYDNEE